MPKCRDNRAKRRKRYQKSLVRLARRLAKRVEREALRESGGKSPRYYKVVVPNLKLRKVRGGSVIHPKTRIVIRKRKEYHDLIAQLLKMCGNITITIPPLGQDEEELDNAP